VGRAGTRPAPTVAIDPGVRRAIIEHATRERPLECCGLLIGQRGRVTGALPARNLARSAVRYELDPRLHIDARRVLREVMPPIAILGVYHSHPRGRAHPSASDIAEAQYPNWIHVIVGFAGARARVAGFRIRGGRVLPVTIVAPVGSGR
jgi:proteasome lid subunit RPN8/RPN11